MDAGLEQAYLQDLPIVLSATRLSQPLSEVPVAMTVIDREMIRASGARTIPELLRLVPGFQVGYFDGNSPVATYHGHGDELSRRVQVLIDGRSIYIPALAAVQWSEELITLEEIERIEVTRGPNAASYGNNAFLAVINITTRHAIEDQGHKVKLTAGSHDTKDALYRFGGSTDALNYRVTLGTRNDEGTDALNDYTRSDYLSYRVDYQVDNYNQLFYQGGFRDTVLGDHEPPPDHENQSRSAFQWLKWEHVSPGDDITSLQYYYNYNQQELTNENLMIKLGADSSDAVRAFLAPIDAFPAPRIGIRSERHDLELQHTRHFDKLRLVSGLSARLDIVSAENVFVSDNAQHHRLYRAFTHGEYRFTPDLLLNAGLMVEDNDISGTDIAPRIALIHHLDARHSVRVGTSRATRTPTLFDQNAYVRTNQQLTQDGGQPLSPVYTGLIGGTDVLNLVQLISPTDMQSEQIRSVELGYIGRLLDNQLLLDVKLFRDKTDRLIFDTSRTTPLPAPEDNFDGEAQWLLNSHRSRMQGLEIALDYKPSPRSRIYGYYAYIDIDAEMYDPRGNVSDIRRLEISAPTHSYGLMLIRHFAGNVDLGISYFRVGEMDWLDRTGSSAEPHQDRSAQSYDKLDIKISKTRKFDSGRLQYALVLQNLLEDYYDYNKTRYTDATQTVVAPSSSSINANGSLQDRRVYLELSWMFN
ncbi:MAG: TonB-dependent receptor [Gammaproteobacteria bacterium]|nr:TonB-dependent receptor [Gammaproteobacteria bacterium]